MELDEIVPAGYQLIMDVDDVLLHEFVSFEFKFLW
jgi:hypothetical protein